MPRSWRAGSLAIDFEDYVRCICTGKDFILPIQYDPRRRRYIEGDDFLPKDLMKRVIDDAHKINVSMRSSTVDQSTALAAEVQRVLQGQG